jgi:hypothetical protein
VLGRPRLDVRRQNSQSVVGGGESGGGPGGDLLGGHAGFVGGVDDLVVDVGDVANIGDVVAEVGEVAADDIEHHGVAAVTEMWLRLHGGATYIHADLARVTGLKSLEGTPERVEDLHVAFQ